jgi:hypothetical protein
VIENDAQNIQQKCDVRGYRAVPFESSQGTPLCQSYDPTALLWAQSVDRYVDAPPPPKLCLRKPNNAIPYPLTVGREVG